MSMSALLDEAIQLCRAEELKLTEHIRQCKDLLSSMKARVKVSSEAQPPSSVEDNDIPLKERQEVELLDQVLKKALKIRSSSTVSSTCCDKRNPRKSSSSTELKPGRQRAGPLKTTVACGDGAAQHILGKTVPASGPTVKGRQSGLKPLSKQKCTGLDVRIKPCQMSRCSPESERGLASACLSSSEEVRTSCSAQKKATQSGASAPEERWCPSTLLPLWQEQQAKKNKLWTKVLTKHSMPVPEREHFKKKLIGTFPTNWASVHLAAMEAELDALTQLGLDLRHCYNAELQRHRMEPSSEKKYESLLMLTELEKMMVRLLKDADRLKKDWESRLAWCHGACPLRSTVEWHHSPQPPHPLPPMLAYSHTAELEDLHSLRLQVAELKLDSHMHQAMCDTLPDLISAGGDSSSSSSHLSATALRGAYSLLCEGGSQFPSLVLDTQLNHDGR